MKFYGTNDGKVYYKHDDNINVILTDEEIERLNNGHTAELVDGVIQRTVPVVDTFVEIKIPVALYKASTEIKEIVDDIVNFYSDTHRKKKNGIITISNINIKDVKEEIDKTQYEELKTAGVIFPPEVDDLFSENTEDEETV